MPLRDWGETHQRLTLCALLIWLSIIQFKSILQGPQMLVSKMSSLNLIETEKDSSSWNGDQKHSTISQLFHQDQVLSI